MLSTEEKYKEVEEIIERLDKLYDEKGEQRLSEVYRLQARLDKIADKTYGYMSGADASKLTRMINMGRGLIDDIVSEINPLNYQDIYDATMQDLYPDGPDDD